MLTDDKRLSLSAWLPVDVTYSRRVTAEIAEWCDAPHGDVVTIDSSLLTATQEFTYDSSLSSVMSADGVLPPIAVVKMLGVMYIDDGHNRAIRALMRGESVTAIVYESS